jgi:DNA-binding NtrC family response regulator
MISVLVAHDEWEVRELLEAFLRHSGYYVVTVPTAEAALLMMDVLARPKVVIIGVDLRCWPNGPWLADRLRNLYPRTATILVMDEGTVRPVDRLPHGVISYLIKPLEREQVLQAVEDGLRRSLETQKASL